MKILIRKVRILSENRVYEFQVFQKYARPEFSRDDEQHAHLIEKHNQELRSHIIPAYEEMATLISTKAHLAEPEVIEGFDTFYTYLKLWQDHLAEPIAHRFPSPAAIELGEKHKEPREYFEMIEQHFEEKLIKYRNLVSRNYLQA